MKTASSSRSLSAVEEANERQKHVLADKIAQRFGEDLNGTRFALWGLAFKPNTDDMREAPSRVIIAELLQRGATITAYDPVAMTEARHIYGEREARSSLRGYAPMARPRRRRRAGDRDRVEGFPQSRLRRREARAQVTRDLRRAQPVRACGVKAARPRVLSHRARSTPKSTRACRTSRGRACSSLAT